MTIELNDERKFSIIKVTTKQVHERDFYDFSVTGLQRCGTSFIFNLSYPPSNNSIGRISHKPVYKISVGVKSKQFLPSSQSARGH